MKESPFNRYGGHQHIQISNTRICQPTYHNEEQAKGYLFPHMKTLQQGNSEQDTISPHIQSG